MIPRTLLAASALALILPAQTTAWIPRNPSTAPAPRAFHAAAYDAARGCTVLFGGWDGKRAFGDTWCWDGDRWTQMVTVGGPSARYAHALAYDSARQRVVLFGGITASRQILGDTWEWDGKSWTRMQPKSSPGGRRFHSMSYHAGKKKVLATDGIVGPGSYTAESWTWDGKTWLRVADHPAGKLGMSALAYDSRRQRVVAFGGTSGKDAKNGTWEWDGTRWWTLNPRLSPPGRSDHGLVYDASTGLTCLFGGFDHGTKKLLQDSVWAWDGSAWSYRPGRVTPKPRANAVFVQDTRRRRALLFGGGARIPETLVTQDTWEYGSLSLSADAVTLSVSAGGAVHFSLGVPASHSGKVYVLLGSMSGTTPGLQLGSLLLPLNASDPWFHFLLGNPNSLINPSIGFLRNGMAQARLQIPAGLASGLQGTWMHHAYVAIAPATASFDFVSNAMPLQLTR